jgi:hypothetical protein
LSFACALSPVLASDFNEFQRGHFIIYASDRDLASRLSWKAEYHYKRIIRHLGVRKFRPWEDEDKCPIYIYETKEDYLKATGAPVWSEGLAQYQPFRFSSYAGAPNLFVSTLPHEMTHMLLYLFMNKKPIPVWLNEGMAQFEEEGRSTISQRKRLIKQHVRDEDYIALKELLNMQRVPEDNVGLFYAESASVIDHLLTDNIRTNFGKFLTRLKKGQPVEKALKKVYQWKYKKGITELEQRWLEFVNKRY